MYSHLNETLAERDLWVNLYNETDKPIEVWIGSSFAGPNRSEVHTGHMAAVRFLRQLGAQAGYIVEIPAGKRFVVADHLMNKKDLLSGFVNFQIVGEGKLRAEVHSALSPARNETRGVTRIGGPFNPFRSTLTEFLLSPTLKNGSTSRILLSLSAYPSEFLHGRSILKRDCPTTEISVWFTVTTLF